MTPRIDYLHKHLLTLRNAVKKNPKRKHWKILYEIILDELDKAGQLEPLPF
jgi:hypothetical protein